MKQKYAPVGFFYLAGLIFASFLSSVFCFVLAAVFLAAGAAPFLLKKRDLSICLWTFCAAAAVFGLYSLILIEPQRSFSGKTARVTGTVLECERPDNDTVRLTVSGEADGVPVKLSLYTPDFGAAPGDRITFTAVFSDLQNHAGFAESDYSFSKGIFLKAKSADTPIITERAGFSFLSLPGAFSSYLRGRIGSVVQGDAGGLLRALFFGDKSGLSPRLSVLLKRAGLSHMTAVSGMHLSLIVGIAAAFLRLLPKRRVRLRFFLTAGLTAALMLFFGLTVSVLRSGAMLILYYGAEPLRRKASPVHTLGFAAMAITLFQPCACRDAGLWLSILGTFGAGTVSPAVCRRLLKKPRFRKIKEALIVSFCAALCTVPVSALCFGGVSLVSALSSLLVYPMFFAALASMLLTAASGGMLAEIFLLPAGLAAKGIIAAAELLGGFRFSYLELGGIYPSLFALTAIGALLTALLTGRFRCAARFFALSVCVLTAVFFADHLIYRDSIVISVYSDGSDGLAVIKSKTGVSAIASSDSAKISREIFSASAGQQTLLLCVLEEEENNREELQRLRPLALHLSDDPDRIYDVSGEYKVTAQNGVLTLETRGITIALLPAGEQTDADFAVCTGWKKEPGASGAGTEIFCDKRYTDSKSANAYYDKVEIVVSAGGDVLLRRERSGWE